MNVLRCVAVLVLVMVVIPGCESDSDSSGGSAVSPGTDATPDAQADSSGDTTTPSPADDTAESTDVQEADGSDGPEDAGGDPSANVDASQSADVSSAGDGASSIDDLIVGDGACTNDSDLAILAEFDLIAEQMAIGQACYAAAGGPGQTSTEDVMACFVETLSTDYGISVDCSGCVTGQILCLQEFCMDACMSAMMSGQSSEACDTCVEENGCNSTFIECSGLNSDFFNG
jgi:hypothetical protein